MAKFTFRRRMAICAWCTSLVSWLESGRQDMCGIGEKINTLSAAVSTDFHHARANVPRLRQTDRRTDIQADRQAGRQAGRQGRQTNRSRHSHATQTCNMLTRRQTVAHTCHIHTHTHARTQTDGHTYKPTLSQTQLTHTHAHTHTH